MPDTIKPKRKRKRGPYKGQPIDFQERSIYDDVPEHEEETENFLPCVHYDPNTLESINLPATQIQKIFRRL